MKFLSLERAHETRFIEVFNDGSGVYARKLTQTELDKIRVDARRFKANETRTEELVERRLRIGHMQAAISDWKGFEDEDGTPIPFSKETVRKLYEVNPTYMNIVYTVVSNEVHFLQDEEEKNSDTGASA